MTPEAFDAMFGRMWSEEEKRQAERFRRARYEAYLKKLEEEKAASLLGKVDREERIKQIDAEREKIYADFTRRADSYSVSALLRELGVRE